MFLAEKTVKNYVSSMLAKLGLESRTQAAIFSTKHPQELSPGPALAGGVAAELAGGGTTMTRDGDRGHGIAESTSTISCARSSARVHGALDEQAALRLLLDAVVSMAADLTLDGVLTRIVEIARDLAGAQYAALGVLDVRPERPAAHLHPPRDDARAGEEIGDLPTGHGLLGLLIDRPEPLAAARHRRAPRVLRLPAEPPADAVVPRCPVRIRDQVFGNLYLTEKPGDGDFTDAGRGRS